MARELLVLWAGRHQRGPWQSLCADYQQRIARMMPVREQAIKVRATGDDLARRRAEGEALLAASPQPCWGIALDPRGEAISSEEWSRRLTRLRQEWPHAVVFYLGSDLGLDPAVLSAARQVLSFGPITLGHELARLVLHEQLYRALSIEAGINYHRTPL